MKKALKILALSMACASSLVATSANAWYIETYYNAQGQYIGYKVYCDNGVPIYAQGGDSSIFTVEYHTTEPPC